jgi:hypothetical protein
MSRRRITPGALVSIVVFVVVVSLESFIVILLFTFVRTVVRSGIVEEILTIAIAICLTVGT